MAMCRHALTLQVGLCSPAKLQYRSTNCTLSSDVKPLLQA